MTTSVTTNAPVAEWIKRIAEDERERDAARLREQALIARKAELVRRNGRRLIDELRAAVTRDVRAFRDEFPGDAARAIVVESAANDGGFVVRKPAPAAVMLTVTANFASAALACDYRFTLADSLPPREDHADMTFAADEGETLQLKHHRTAEVFANADALSEFLLMPVLSGRPR